MNVRMPGEGDLTAFWIIIACLVGLLVGSSTSSAGAAGRALRQAEPAAARYTERLACLNVHILLPAKLIGVAPTMDVA